MTSRELVHRTLEDEIHRAIVKIHGLLWQDGGCIAQCEFGPGARPENVRQVFAGWDAVTGGKSS
jgi:hypothetical protein